MGMGMGSIITKSVTRLTWFATLAKLSKCKVAKIASETITATNKMLTSR